MTSLKDTSDSLKSSDSLVAHSSTTDSGKSMKSTSGGGSWGRSKANSLTKRLVPVLGYVLVTADYTGSIKVLTKRVT